MPKRKSLQGFFYRLTVIFFLSGTALIQHHHHHYHYHYHYHYHDYIYDNHQIIIDYVVDDDEDDDDDDNDLWF